MDYAILFFVVGVTTHLMLKNNLIVKINNNSDIVSILLNCMGLIWCFIVISYCYDIRVAIAIYVIEIIIIRKFNLSLFRNENLNVEIASFLLLFYFILITMLNDNWMIVLACGFALGWLRYIFEQWRK